MHPYFCSFKFMATSPFDAVNLHKDLVLHERSGVADAANFAPWASPFSRLDDIRDERIYCNEIL